MTNEELVSVLAEIPRKPWHDLDRETVHDVCREAAARLRKADADVAFANACADETSDDCDAALVASETGVSDLRRRLKLAEDALEASLSYTNSEELRKAQRKAKRALAAIRRDGGAK